MTESERSTPLSLAGLVHDMNNVFETISEAGELLSEDPRWHDLSGSIQRSADCGRRLIAGFVEQTRSRLDLELVLSRAATFLHDFRATLGAQPLKVSIETPPGLHLRGQASDWERVFMNLLLNAAQAMPGGGNIAVRARSEDGVAHISVCDDGPGIAPEILAHVFEAHVSTHNLQRGLGLHIVRSIVDGYGGSVAAENRADAAGARILIATPLA